MHSKAVRAVPVMCPQTVQRLLNSFVQDLVFGVIGGRIKDPTHILLPYAVTSLTNNTDLVQITNRCGHGVSYPQLEELNTAMCLQKLAATPENMVPLPENIKPYISTSLASCARLAQLVKSLTANPGGPRFNPRPGRGLNFGRPSFATPSVGRDVRPLV